MTNWTMNGEATMALSRAISVAYEKGKPIERVEVAEDVSFKWFDFFLKGGGKIQFFYSNSDDWAVRTPSKWPEA